ncbi:MAG: class I SAM-dependent methyltransferase [Planctomycetota bacterium]|nr:class I SAM-dependent methyltransferase [Planctomycetota bacterium]
MSGQTNEGPIVPIADPQAPHDDLTFEELGARYNYMMTSDRARVFVRLLLKELSNREHPVRALDIGCGEGISESKKNQVEYLRVVRAHVDELWAIEPDPNVNPSHGLLDVLQHSTMETAKLPENAFDVVYSYFVMEHVPDPTVFLQAAYRCLKPGGVYLFMTPNARHYFTMIARTLKAMWLDELVLRAVTRGASEDYHYPVMYRCNSQRRLSKYGARAGFERVDFAYLETRGPRCYFPRPLLFVHDLLAMKRRWIRSPGCLLELLCRMKKGG